MKNYSKKIVAFLVFCLSLSCAFGQDAISISSWSYVTQAGESNDLDGKFPLVVKAEKPANADDGVAFESHFSLPATWSGPLGIVLFKNNMSCKVFVNDVYIDTLGRPGPKFFFQPYITRGVLVPQAILKDDNILRLELWNDTGSYKLRMIEMMGGDAYRSAMNRFNFLDVQLPRFATILLLFVAVYSMFFFINYREKRESLFLSLGALFFAVYLLNVSAFDSSLSYLPLKAFFYSCFPLSILFLFRFFRIFLKMNTSDRVMWAINGIGVVFTLGYYFQRNTASLDSWHSIMLIYPVAAIVYSMIGVVACLKKKSWEHIPILIGLVAAIFFSAYDIYYFVLDLTPFILLQGIGFMGMILGTFYSFSQGIANTNKKVTEYSLEMEINKETRDALFTQIQEDTAKSESIGSKLDESIERVGTLVTQYLVSVDHINQNIVTQSEQVSSNKRSVEEIFSALAQTAEMVKHHESLVEVTVRNVRDLTEGIHRTDELVKASGSTIKQLSSVCLAADKDVAESSRFVDDLANYSQNINEIVKSISDLAEQTNILSINAAIEAARSGAMGKGFAVVAGEIRSLASKSGESANQINVILGTMVEKIRNIQKQEAQVSLRLRDIIRENGNIDQSIAEIVRVLEAQRERNSVIGSSISDLVSAVRNILAQTSAQKSHGETIRQSVLKLEAVTQAIVTSSDEQKQCNEELKGNLDQLRSVSESNLDVIMDLKNLIS